MSYTKDSEGNFNAPAAVTLPTVVTEVNLSEGTSCKLTRAERQGISSARSSNADLDDFMTMLRSAAL